MKTLSSYCIFLFICLSMSANAQCDESATKIMVMGDSWAFFSWQGDSYNENLDRFGFSDIEARSNLSISILGSKASNYFNKTSRKKAVIDFLEKNSDIEIVHFSLGGNDILRAWHKDMNSFEEDSVLNKIIHDIRGAMDTLWAYKPSLDIHFAGYEYPNFAETISTISPPWLQKQHPFYDLWDEMGKPNIVELNSIIRKSTQYFIDSIANHKNVSFVNNLGLMQWHYGQQKKLKTNPFGTYQPHTVPLPGGDINYPTPLVALNADGLDSYHLKDKAFEVFIKRQFEEFYWSYFRNADTTFVGIPNQNGSTSNSRISDTLFMGNSNNHLLKSVLSFDTKLNSHKVIKSASIFIQREKLFGKNLIDENLILEIKTGHYGASSRLELDDFDAPSDSMSNACTFGNLQKDGYWMRVDVPKSLLPFINKNGTTQFKLNYHLSEENRFINFTNELKSILLDVRYEDVITNIGQTSYDNISNIILSPNPCDEIINLLVNEAEIIRTEIYNMYGQLVHVSQNPTNKIHVQQLNKGHFIIKIYLIDKIVTKTFIKQ